MSSAILILSFAGAPGQSYSQLSAVVTDFLASCKEAGKTKLIIDVSSNGGGKVFFGYDTFKQVHLDISLFVSLHLTS